MNTIKEIINKITNGKCGLVIVVDNDKINGIITDGDIRRAILNGKSLGDSIENIYFRVIDTLVN